MDRFHTLNSKNILIEFHVFLLHAEMFMKNYFFPLILLCFYSIMMMTINKEIKNQIQLETIKVKKKCTFEETNIEIEK